MRAVRDAPLICRSVESCEQAGIGGQPHLARFARLKLDPFEAEEPYALLVGRFSELTKPTRAYLSNRNLMIMMEIALALLV
jgi:hypothetical protein